MGLRVGYIVGLLEALCSADGVRKVQRSSEDGRDITKGDGQRYQGLLVQAKEELKIQKLCGEEYWRSDGIWAYEVQGKAGEEDVTFWEVVDQHPAVRKWLEKVRDEMRNLGIESAEEGFSGVGVGEGGVRLENLVETMSVVEDGAREL